MATLVSSVLADANIILNDNGVRWVTAELVRWFNEAQLQIVQMFPPANTKNVSVALVPGTKQTLPPSAILLIDIVRNMGASGTTPGKIIRVTTRESLDSADPNWHASAPTQLVSNYMYNPADPTHFYVYPPQPASPSHVELVYSAVPATVDGNGSLGLPDQYSTAVLEYVLYRAFSKDAEVAASRERASAHFQAFRAAVAAADSINGPGMNLSPLNTQGPTG